MMCVCVVTYSYFHVFMPLSRVNGSIARVPMHIIASLRCFFLSRPFDPASSVTFSSDVSWHRSLCISLWCIHSAAILLQWCMMVSLSLPLLPSEFNSWRRAWCVHSKYLRISEMCTARILQKSVLLLHGRISVLLLQWRISVFLLYWRILVKHLRFHSEWKTEKRREKWREVKRGEEKWREVKRSEEKWAYTYTKREP